jgi:hypothetical protein
VFVQAFVKESHIVQVMQTEPTVMGFWMTDDERMVVAFSVYEA